MRPLGTARQAHLSLTRILSALAIGGALVFAAASPPTAFAGDQFTLDAHADSIGPVVVDEGGTGYVAWLHKGSPDTVMFCKIASGARKCTSSVTLAVGLSDPGATTDTPYTVLGPGAVVFVVAPSYDTNQMVMWESTDGGATFGAPYVGPGNSVNLALEYTDTCRVALNLDDVVPFNAYGGQYDRSQGTSTLGSGGASLIEFEMASGDPFATWSFDFYGEPCDVPDSTTVTPGKIPAQWFSFGEGSGSSGIGTDQTTLGWAGGGTAACPTVAAGDEVEAYTVPSEPEKVQFFRWSAPTGPCSMTGVNVGPSGASNWSGPTTAVQGAYPRLAGGKSGLFLLTGEGTSAGHGAPRAVDIRRYDVSSHSFAAPAKLSDVTNASELQPDWGGLGEGFTTGELAAAWPDIGGDDGLISLFISTDGGAHFSAAQDIARIGFGFAGLDNARVAVAPNGTGFVTWQDSGGLHIADLNTLPVAYERLAVHHHFRLELPVTCEAVTASCSASATVKVGGHVIASGHIKVHSGETAELRLVLGVKGRELLAHAKGHLGATLKLSISHPGASAERLYLHTVLKG